MTTRHLPDLLLRSYAAGNTAAADELWALEAHLEGCAPCRDRLAGVVSGHSPETVVLLDRVQQRLALSLEASPRMPLRPRWRMRMAGWTTPSLLARLGTTVLVIAIAFGLDLTNRLSDGGHPSLILLFSPVAPMLGVAAAWSRRLDPVHELVVASPRAGLYLVLRRTFAVLAVVIPPLAVAGAATGASPARWLLPSLFFTAAALALGEVVGLHRAALGLAGLWIAGVAAPSLITSRLPTLLEPDLLPAWLALSIVAAGVIVVRRNAYTALAGGR